MSLIDTRGRTPIFKLPLPAGTVDAQSVVFFRSRFHVDVDGARNAYGPHNSGQDYTANAGEPNHWWALVCGPDRQPIIRDGFYVSTTSLQDRRYSAEDRLRYVDADAVPYIVLPASRFAAWGVKIGDLAWVQKLDGGNVIAGCAAIFADAGPDVGEGSAALARELDLNPDPRHGGTDELRVQYYIFCGSGTGQPMTNAEIKSKVAALLPALQRLGGLAAPIGKL